MRNEWGLEVGPFNLLRGNPAGIPGRILSVQRIGSNHNTRGYSDPAGVTATGTRVPARFYEPRFTIVFEIFLENLLKGELQYTQIQHSTLRGNMIVQAYERQRVSGYPPVLPNPGSFFFHIRL